MLSRLRGRWLALLAAFVAPACASGTKPEAPAAPSNATTAAAPSAPTKTTAAKAPDAPKATQLPATPAAPTSSAPTAAVPPRAWEHQTSDIPVDGRIKFGAFANGMRWAWASNPEPKERCYVRLHVNVGSLAEEESERGMAHFLEHMGFNGTKHFAPNTLVEWFQNHGMAFGADTNAHTAFSETVYKLDLPKSDAGTIREGLTVLRDFADGMLLSEEEVQAEKGVIDGEERERDSAGWRVLVRTLDVLFENTRIAERLPIGLKEIRDRFDAASIRAFYRRWYRPENMTLVVVGDLGSFDPEPLFAEAFESMAVPAEPLAKEPLPGTASGFPSCWVVPEKEIPTVSLSISRLKPWVDEPADVKHWLRDMPLDYARSMLNLRFSELAKKETAPFLGASVSDASNLDVFEGEDLDIRCRPEKWKEAMATCEQELRKALEFGFRKAELDEVRADALRELDEAVQREPTSNSMNLMGQILAAAENRYVPCNAETSRKILKPAIEALTVEACHAAFRKAWSEGTLNLSANGSIPLGAEEGTALQAAYEASAAVKVEKTAETETAAFAYASDPAKAGKVASREHVEDYDFEKIRFENDVALNVKKTDFKKNQVLVQVNFGEGMLTAAPADSLCLQMVGGVLMNGGGLEAHSADDLRRLTAGKQVGVGFGAGGDRFVLSGATTASDLLFQCELACAEITAPGYREEGLAQFRRSIPMTFEALKHQHAGPLRMEFMPAVFNNDPRVGFPTREALEACGVEQIRAWLAPILVDAPMEVTIVGDLDVEQTVEFAARTFGALPKRRAWRSMDERRNLQPPKAGVKQTHSIETQIPKSLVFLVFPTTDGIEHKRRRSLDLLNEVVSDRMRIQVREKLGAAYSPGSGAQPSTTNPGVGVELMQAISDPEKVQTALDACLGVAESLVKEGVTEEELKRVLEPVLNRRRDAKRTNPWWLEILGRAQSDPNHLPGMRQGDDFYANVKAEDLTPLAKQYLDPARACVLIVNPTPKAAPAGEAPPAK
jgi:zinc protease